MRIIVWRTDWCRIKLSAGVNIESVLVGKGKHRGYEIGL